MKEIKINDLEMLQYLDKKLIVEGETPKVRDRFPIERAVSFGQHHSDGSPFWVVALHDFKGSHDCVMEMTVNVKGLFTPSVFRMMARVVFNYIFVQAKLVRCSSRVRASNTASLRLTKAWGMKHEGIRRLGYQYPEAEDMHLFGMLKTDCPWI